MVILITNGLLLSLMVGAIVYIFLVDLRVRKLLAALNELEPMVGNFSDAVDRSETSLEKFKEADVDKISSIKTADNTGEDSEGEKNVIFKKKQNLMKSQVGWVSLPGKSELVRSFFETARGQES